MHEVLHMTREEWEEWHKVKCNNDPIYCTIQMQGDDFVHFRYAGSPNPSAGLIYYWTREIVGPDRIKFAIQKV